jgi:microcystin-dependent protein
MFAVIGTSFGLGDGATTFNLPDLRGRVVAGQDSMGGVAAGRLTSGGSGVNGNAIGAVGGNEFLMEHVHAIVDKSHTHTLNDPSHKHEQQMGQGTGPTNAWNINETGATVNMGVETQPATTGITIAQAYTGITTTANAGAGASQNTQPTIVTAYIIFAV